MPEVKSTHEVKEFAGREVSRSAASPLLPGGLPGPGGSLLDELMVREATTRVSSVDTEDLAMLQRGRDVKAPATRDKESNRHPGGESATSTVDTAESATTAAASAGAATQPSQVPTSDTGSANGAGEGTDLPALAATHSYDGADGSGFDGGGRKWGTGGGLDSDSEALSTIDLDDSIGQQTSEPAELNPSAGTDAAAASTLPAEEPVNTSKQADAPQPESSHRREPWWPWGRSESEKSTDEQTGQVETASVQERDSQEAASESSSVSDERSRRWPWQSADDEGSESSSASSTSQARKDKREPQAGDGEAMVDADKQASKPWWESLAGLLGRRDEQKEKESDSEATSQAAAKDKSKGEGSVQGEKPASRGQIETVVVSPDLPIAEIAAEIARVKVKEEQDADEQNRLAGEKMMQGPIAQLGRISDQLMKLSKPELVLLCGLSGGVLVLLAVIAYRLELYVQYESIVKDLVQ